MNTLGKSVLIIRTLPEKNGVLYLLIKVENIFMTEKKENPLGLQNKVYDNVEEFGAALRNKFSGDKNISNIILAEIFLSKYPMYSCKIKKPTNHFSQKSCGCC